MAVYTEISDDELDAFVAQYDLGAVLSCKGIAEGVENSNFLLVTEAGPRILTLYEKRVNPEDLPFFLNLLEHLAGKGIACPQPVRARDGIALRTLCDKPAVIVTFLSGMWPRRILPHHCAGLGEGMARLHLAGADFPMTRANNLSVGGWRPLFEASAERADEVRPGLALALATELDTLEKTWPTGLPSGIIHADLFPDNVFFRGESLSGLIDFYFACSDFFAYDVAICLNAWCFEADGSFNTTKARMLLTHYSRVRVLTRREMAVLPLLARGAALRFLLTRLYDWLHQPPGAMVKPKNPLEYYNKLRFHQRSRGVSDYVLDDGGSYCV